MEFESTIQIPTDQATEEFKGEISSVAEELHKDYEKAQKPVEKSNDSEMSR